MRLTTTLAALLSTTALTSARIVGIASPATLVPSQPFTLTLLTENYIQRVSDISVAWGFDPIGRAYTIGSSSSSAYLGPTQSNVLHNVTIDAVVPADMAAWNGKNVVLTAGVYSLYGVSGGATVIGFNVSVKIGEVRTDKVVRSVGQAWVENGS